MTNGRSDALLLGITVVGVVGILALVWMLRDVPRVSARRMDGGDGGWPVFTDGEGNRTVNGYRVRSVRHD